MIQVEQSLKNTWRLVSLTRPLFSVYVVVVWSNGSPTLSYYISGLTMAVGILVEMDLSSYIMECGRRLGYESLKDKQVEAVSTFMKENDIFVSLPTGLQVYNIRYFT